MTPPPLTNQEGYDFDPNELITLTVEQLKEFMRQGGDGGNAVTARLSGDPPGGNQFDEKEIEQLSRKYSSVSYSSSNSNNNNNNNNNKNKNNKKDLEDNNIFFTKQQTSFLLLHLLHV